jgi:hypothetical protein
LYFSIPFGGSSRHGKLAAQGLQTSKSGRRNTVANAVFALAVTLAGCGGGGNSQEQWSGAVVRTQTADSLSAYLVAMPVNSPVTIDVEAIKLEVLQVVDSRCPMMALCISVGEVKVALLVTSAGSSPGSVNLALSPADSDALSRRSTFLNYRITLQDVTPYPAESAQAAADKIWVTVLLEKFKRSAS